MTRRRTTLIAIGAVLGALLLDPSAGTAATRPAATRAVTDDTSVEAPAFALLRGITLADAQARLSWQAVAPDLATSLGGDQPARFGGVWIDVNNGDRVKVAMTGAIDAATTAYVTRVANAVGLTSGYDIVSVARTQATMDTDDAWLGTEIARVNIGATAMLSAGERTDLNAVQLDLPATGALTVNQANLVTAARQRLGADLVLSQGGKPFQPYTCAFPYCDPPLHGGVKINFPGTYCSSAFTAQSKVDSKMYLITAGHCADGNTTTWSSKYSDLSVHTLGSVWHWEWNSTNGDEAIISVTDVAGWNPQGRVEVTAGPDTTAAPDYYIKADKLNVVGQRLCATGVAWGASTCGNVTELGFTTTYGGVTVHNLGRTSTCGKPGDSGAPMYATHIAYGIMVGGADSDPGDCDIIFQGIRGAESILNVNVLHATS